MKILVFSTDLLPLAGLATSGTALRTYGLAMGLRAAGHEVIISMPKAAVAGLKSRLDFNSFDQATQNELKQIEALAFDATNQNHIIQDINPDVILCGHWPALTISTKPSQILIVDLAGPHLLERHYQGEANHRDAVLGKLSVIAAADYFIVSGPAQRLYFLSFLNRAGVEQPEKRIITITMPLNPEVPERISWSTENEFPRLLFGGVFLPWQDPRPGLEAAVTALDKHQKGSLQLIGGEHPNYKIRGGVYEELFKKLALNPRVQTSPMLAYEQFIERMLEADAAIDLMAWNLERQLAVTIRSTTYLWSGVPVLYNDYADLAHLINEYDAGWCVNPNDQSMLANVLDEIFSNPAALKQKSLNASRLAREHFAWDQAVKPLLNLFGARQEAARYETDIYLDLPENADISLNHKNPIEQDFIARMNGLYRVECRIATQGSACPVPINVSLFRNADTGRQMIHSKTFAAESIFNNDWLTLETNPIQDSAGASFSLKLEVTNETKSLKISPWALNSNPYPMRELRQGNKTLKHHAICLRTTCVDK